MFEPAGILDLWMATMGRACWQGSLVVLAVWAICRLIPSMPARLRSWFWRLAIVKFAVVLLLPFAFRVPVLPAPSGVADEFRASALSCLSASESDTVGTYQVSAGLSWMHVAFCLVWFVGVGWSLVRLQATWRAARRLRKQSRPVEHLPTLEQLAKCARMLGLRTALELREIPGCGSPMLIGILRPAILLRAETWRRLSAAEQAMVFGHELAHLRRGDLFWSAVAAFVRAVFFFHPLVWLCERQLGIAQETAADAMAIGRQQQDPVSYGKLMVSVVGKLGPGRLLPVMSMGATGAMGSLTRRLSAMEFYGRVTRRVSLASIILLAGVILLGLVPWKLVAAEAADSEKPSVQRIATIKLSQVRPGEPKAVLCAPRIVFHPGSDATMAIGDGEQNIEITIHTIPDQQPMQHLVKLEFRNHKGEEPVVLTASKIILDGKQGKIACEGAFKLEVEASITPLK